MCTVCIMTQTFDPARHSAGEPIFADINETIDAAEGLSTTYEMSVGDTFYGTLSSSTDADWVRIDLTAGTTYAIAHTGISLSDPYLRLYDSSGTLITYDDDGGSGYNSLLEFTATTSGTYYVSADAFSTETGTYALSVSETTPTPPPGVAGSLEDMATFLREGTDGYAVTYNTSSSNVITVNLDGLTTEGQQLARWAMEAWEMVVDLDFVEVASGETITVDDEEAGAFAYFPNSGSTPSGVELNISQNWLTNSGTTLDSYSFQTFVHEFGHAIGLRHQGDYNASGGAITYDTSAYFTNDSWQTSVMSYFSQTDNTTTNASFAYLSGAMMADIMAIQELYGAPGSSAVTAGNTTYGEGSNLDNYMDQIFDWFSTGTTTSNVTGNTMAFTIYDQGGVDTLNFGFLTEAARLDMRAAQFSDIGSLTDIMGIAHNTTIEHAITGSSSDTVTGNSAANRLTTNGGNDLISAGAGYDTVYAGEGNDTVDGGNGRDRIFLNQGNDVFNDNTQGGAHGQDTVFAGLGNDTIEGGNGNDVFYGQDGDDLIYGRLGGDLIYGGNQFDTVHAGEGADTVYGGNGGDQVFLNQGHDVFHDNGQGGANGQDTVFAGLGNDTIQGGNGNDVFHGQAGNDLIYGRLGNDNIYGGSQRDTLYGGAGDDNIYGGNGQDRIFMGNGDDHYVDTAQGGTLGRDTITGGAGADTFVFGEIMSQDVITDFAIGVDTLELASGLAGGQSAIQLAAAASITGAGVLLSFDAGQSILLQGLNSTVGLAGDIDFF